MRILYKITVVVLLVLTLVLSVYISYLAARIPSLDGLSAPGQHAVTTIYSRDDSLIGRITTAQETYITIDKIPRNMVNAVVAVEDNRFFRHEGIDFVSIARAVVSDITHHTFREGGSTITQQLARTVYLTNEKTVERKLQEILIASKIEMKVSKDRILELYLNRVFMGHGLYGVGDASLFYFGKPVTELGLAECAMLAGVIRSPLNYSPMQNYIAAMKRQSLVLTLMETNGFIKRSEKEAAINTPLSINSGRDPDPLASFIQVVKKELIDKYGSDKVYNGGLKVYTTMDTDYQKAAFRTLRKALSAIDKEKGWRGALKRIELVGKNAGIIKTAANPYKRGDIMGGVVLYSDKDKAFVNVRGIIGILKKSDAVWAKKLNVAENDSELHLEDFNLKHFLLPGDVITVGIKGFTKGQLYLTLEQRPALQGAVIVMDNRNGSVRALVGGYDPDESEFNRATMARRQPGSSFKPVIYAMALEKGMTVTSTIEDQPISFKGADGRMWNPMNADAQFRGGVTLSDALKFSLNTVAVRLAQALGVDEVIGFAKKMGIESEYPHDLSIALGTMTVTPLDMAAAYSPFANGGRLIKPVFIRYVTDDKGDILEKNVPVESRVISDKTSEGMTAMLRGVVESGTGFQAHLKGYTPAGKTGTSDGYRDAWFIGYVNNVTALIWVGYDDNKPIGDNATASRIAVPIWTDFMKSIQLH